MKFTFEGQNYVIAFAHDPSRDWAAHAGHQVVLEWDRETGFALFCLNCETQLSPVPKAQRPRVTICRIEKVDAAAASGRLLIVHGVGRCNPRDRWTREGGRLAALRNALGFDADSESGWATQMSGAQIKAFRAAAWTAYQTRHWDAHTEKLRAESAPAIAPEASAQ